jgi:GINS complex subunit 1
MNYGQNGKDLLLDLKRSDWLPSYNDENVRATINEIKVHFEELTDQAKAAAQATAESGNAKKLPMQTRPAMLLHEAAIRRNKRCLLAYHAYRLDKLKALRWDTSASLPDHIRSLLSEKEVDFYTEYDKLVASYNSTLGVLDLNSYMQPPEEDLIEVRVVQSGLGTIVTDHFGEVSLELGTTHFLSRGDVEHLIRQGSLQQLDAEETY